MADEAKGAPDEHMETEQDAGKADGATASPMNDDAAATTGGAAPTEGAAAAAVNGTSADAPDAAADAAANGSPRDDAHDRRRHRHYRDVADEEGGEAGKEYQVWEEKGAGAEASRGSGEHEERHGRDNEEGRKSRDGEERGREEGDGKSERRHKDDDDKSVKEGEERRTSRKDKKEKKDKRSRRSRSRSGDSRSRSRSRSRRHRSGRSRSRSRHRSSRRHTRSRSRSRDRYRHRRDRSRSYDRPRRRSTRDSGGSEEEEAFGGYRPRKRQEPPAKKGVSGVSAYHDPFFHLRQANAAQDPQEALRRWQEQQLQARQLVLQQQAASAAAAASKSQRELYIGNLVPGAVNEATLRQVFDSGLIAAFPAAAAPGKTPVIKVNMHSEGKYGFVEFRTPEFATAAMALSGQVILGGQAISIGRPAGYVDPAKAQLAAAQAGVALAAFKAGDVSAASSLLAAPGVAAPPANPLMMGLPGMALPPPPAYPGMPGIAGVPAAAPPPGAPASAGQPGGLPSLLMAAQHAATIVAPSPPVPALPQPLSLAPPQQSALAAALAQAMPTQYLCVAGMVNAETLADDFEYREVIIDLKDECSKSGTVVEVKVPRPPNPAQSAYLINDPSNNYGKAFVHFEEVDGAARARQAINGRMFAGSLVQVTFVSQAVFVTVPAN